MDIKIQNDVAQGSEGRAKRASKETAAETRKSAETAVREQNIALDTISIQGAAREVPSSTALRNPDGARDLSKDIAASVTYDQLLSAHGGLDPERVAALLDEEA